jgi:NTP pyrophosphatase (non-canonical NTP hydrolase)
MNFNEYQRLAAKTAGMHLADEIEKKLIERGLTHNAARVAAEYFAEEKGLYVSTLGIAGEAGEFADLIKKQAGHGHASDPVKEKKELGDILWYVADVCTKKGYDLGEVAALNIEKLKARYPEGFSTEKSQNRKPGDI